MTYCSRDMALAHDCEGEGIGEKETAQEKLKTKMVTLQRRCDLGLLARAVWRIVIESAKAL